MTYISVDVETTGTIPGFHSLLSVGACVSDERADNGLNTFHHVISGTDDETLNWDMDTYEWWHHPDQKLALDRLNGLANVFPESHYSRLTECAYAFADWLVQFDPPRFFVAWPSSFDYPFIQSMFNVANTTNLFTYRTIDIKSYACGKLNLDFNCGHNDFPDWMLERPEFPHDALSDSISQLGVFNKLLICGSS